VNPHDLARLLQKEACERIPCAIFSGGGQMFSYALSLSAAVPNNILDMTADFAPLFVGLVVVLGLSVLGLVGAIGFHDTREAQHKAKKATVTPVLLRKAA
jgi:hypothetical protein